MARKAILVTKKLSRPLLLKYVWQHYNFELSCNILFYINIANTPYKSSPQVNDAMLFELKAFSFTKQTSSSLIKTLKKVREML